MAMRLSKDQILANKNRLDSTRRKTRKIAPPTTKGYSLILQYWEDYLDRLDEKPDLAPDFEWLRSFFDTLAREHPGMLGPHLSLNVLNAYATRLTTAGKQRYGWDIQQSVIEEVKDFMGTELKDELGLSKKTREKPMADSQDLDVLIKYLWSEDQHTFRHESDRTKLALYLLILAYTAARPGAVVVSDAYRKSGEALTYKDLKFCISKDEEGRPPLMSLTITFNLMKGDRNEEDKFIKLTLWEDRVYPHLCPLILFLSIAFEHRAFDLEPEDLFRPLLDRDIVEVNFKDDVLDTPVFRSWDGVAAWTYSGCSSAVKALAYRAGYRCQVTSYCIRRGAVNVLDKSVTWAETGLLLGHKNPKVIQSHYLNRHLSIELQGLFHGKPTKTDRLRPLRSLAAERFPGAPTSLQGTKLYHELTNDPEYLARRQEWKDLKQCKASKPLIKAAKSKMDSKLATLRRKATEQFRSDWIKVEGSRYLRTEQTDNPYQESAEDRYVLPPYRAAVVDLLYHSIDQSQEHRLKLLCSLRALSTIHYGAQTAYPCPRTDCKRHHKPFKTKVALEQHQLLHKGMMYICPFANCNGKSFKSRAALTRHCHLHESLGYPCPERDCDHHETPFPTKAALVTHHKQSHKTLQGQNKLGHFCTYPHCLRYKKPFASKRDRDRHCERIHSSSEYSCPFHSCIRHRKKFTNQNSLACHLSQVHYTAGANNHIPELDIPLDAQSLNPPTSETIDTEFFHTMEL